MQGHAKYSLYLFFIERLKLVADGFQGSGIGVFDLEVLKGILHMTSNEELHAEVIHPLGIYNCDNNYKIPFNVFCI
jgi:hypothetical protein